MLAYILVVILHHLFKDSIDERLMQWFYDTEKDFKKQYGDFMEEIPYTIIAASGLQALVLVWKRHQKVKRLNPKIRIELQNKLAIGDS